MACHSTWATASAADVSLESAAEGYELHFWVAFGEADLAGKANRARRMAASPNGRGDTMSGGTIRHHLNCAARLQPGDGVLGLEVGDVSLDRKTITFSNQ